MSTRSLVLTIIGPDRPGLVETLSRAIDEHGGNWLESQMAQLAGQFAGLLRVEVEPESVDGLRAALAACETAGLKVHVIDGEDIEATARAVTLEVVGGDRPGIMRRISQVIADKGVNVQRLETTRTGAPWSGGALFRAEIALEMPPGVALEALREALEAIALDLMVEVRIDTEVDPNPS